MTPPTNLRRVSHLLKSGASRLSAPATIHSNATGSDHTPMGRPWKPKNALSLMSESPLVGSPIRLDLSKSGTEAGATVKILPLLCLVLMFAGCATDVANRYYGNEKYPPKSAQEVELLWQRPSRDFTVIADLQARGESPEGMRRRAAKIGADAVIVAVIGGVYNTSEEWVGSKPSSIYSRITGTAIRYK